MTYFTCFICLLVAVSAATIDLPPEHLLPVENKIIPVYRSKVLRPCQLAGDFASVRHNVPLEFGVSFQVDPSIPGDPFLQVETLKIYQNTQGSCASGDTFTGLDRTTVKLDPTYNDLVMMTITYGYRWTNKHGYHVYEQVHKEQHLLTTLYETELVKKFNTLKADEICRPPPIDPWFKQVKSNFNDRLTSQDFNAVAALYMIVMIPTAIAALMHFTAGISIAFKAKNKKTKFYRDLASMLGYQGIDQIKLKVGVFGCSGKKSNRVRMMPEKEENSEATLSIHMKEEASVSLIIEDVDVSR